MQNIGQAALLARATPKIAATPEDDPKKMQDAGQQFEALLLAQMLSSAHDPDSGWLGGGDASSGAATGFAEQQLALVIAQNGGLGLGRMIAEGLKRREPT